LSVLFANAAGNWLEDPGTGSACANLGAWWIHHKRALPAKFVLSQGELTGRPCQLYLDIIREAEIRLGGRVVEIGRGSIQI
jgi:trans-2,3-dihydro-3-hydroxyanthranilate isomerase